MTIPHRIVNPETLVKPVGYNHGVLCGPGRLLCLAGQNGVDASGRVVDPGDMVAQIDRALANLLIVVASAGGSPDHVVNLVFYVTDMAAYRRARPSLGAVWRRHFGSHFPAMTLVAVADLFEAGTVVEIDGWAVVPPEE